MAPLGAFGAMAFTIGRYGLVTLLSLGKLMLAVYATCFVFIFVGLGVIAALAGFSIIGFIRYIMDEILIVLGTSSSESVLPRMIAKMEDLGCDPAVVGLVDPDRIFVQSGWHLHLSDDGGAVPGAGDQHGSVAVAADRILAVLLLTSRAPRESPGRASSCWRRRYPRSVPSPSPRSP